MLVIHSRAAIVHWSLAFLITLGAAAPAVAQPKTQQQRTQEVTSQRGGADRAGTVLDENDQLIASIWGLSSEEMLRAKVLLQGPRKSFSVENLSPVEALGIHARSDAERRKYAEMFARTFHADVERSLAWNAAFTEAMARMYPNEPVMDFSGQAKVAAPIGAADMLNVPRSLVVDTLPGTGTPKASKAR
ncbi:hypothetical protein [Acidovorax sp. SUPP2539]|uniref:hypothetical protein n=1 Tax=Acidovorax sp. SUPP2539 TaxID=2920878 RepID=UPI0023DE634C|nr:hypothetical protein [Acidovorax sp. SUPP2539]GKS92651.1 integrating conjugative element protein [Acidovorax sp. SUPP2539]